MGKMSMCLTYKFVCDVPVLKKQQPHNAIEPVYEIRPEEVEWEEMVEVSVDDLVEYLSDSYHYQIDPTTIGIIIKNGFMSDDYLETDEDFVSYLKKKHYDKALKECKNCYED